jgi:hypothetical protein
MMNRRHRFNIYLVLALSLGVFCGCQSEKSKSKKPLSTLRLHEEMKPDALGRTEEASIFRAQPVKLTVSKEPFLTEANVRQAKVVDTPYGFALSIQFDQQGSWLLEEYSAADKGKHIAIYSQFMSSEDQKLNVGRWLAAPLIQTHIPDGLLIFTPDATREETERIALGLNDVASKLQNGQELKW